MPSSIDQAYFIYQLDACGNVQKPFHFQQSHESPLVHASFLALFRLRNERKKIQNRQQCLWSTKGPLPMPNQTPPKAHRSKWPYRPECIQVPHSRRPNDAHHRMKIESPLLDWFRDLFGWSSPRRSSVLVAIEERSSRSRYSGLVLVRVERDREAQDLPSLM